MKKYLFLALAALMVISTSALAQKETKFFTSFEYGSLDDEPEAWISPDELNGADDQVGEWAGEDLPDAVNDGSAFFDEGIAGGFKNNPYDGGRLLAIDRPGPGEDGDFKGSIDAVLSDPVLLLGAEVSFQIGVRRTGGNNDKDFDIVGRGSDGTESFRVRVGTNNNGGERLGFVTDDGATVQFDLPTVVGDDRPADLNNTGYNAGLPGPFPEDTGGPGANAEFPDIKISLASAGYTISLAHDELNTSGEANSYVSDVLPYNGAASDLALVEFGYSAAGATGRNSGWFLDNILVEGFEDILQGDFDFDGTLGFGDFVIIAENFGAETSDGDFDFNGVVDLADFAAFRLAYETQEAGGGVAAVPEPGGLGLFAIGIVAVLARRRRR